MAASEITSTENSTLRTEMFHRPLEIFMVIGPLLFFVLLPYDGRLGTVGDTSRTTLQFAIDFFFLNGLHLTASFVLFLIMPEYRSWTRETSFGKWALPATVFILFMSQALLVGDVFRAEITFFTVFFGARFHNIMQSFGISQIYNQHLMDRQPEERARIEHTIRYERALAWFLYFASITWFLAGFYWKYEALAWLAAAGTRAAALALIALAVLTPGSTSTFKVLFSLRYAAYLLEPWSQVGTAVILSSHYIEHVAVTAKFESHYRERSASRKLMLVLAGAGLLMSALILLRPHYTKLTGLTEADIAGSLFWMFFLQLNTSISLAHFFLDSCLFRSSTGALRYVGSVLKRPLNRS